MFEIILIIASGIVTGALASVTMIKCEKYFDEFDKEHSEYAK